MKPLHLNPLFSKSKVIAPDDDRLAIHHPKGVKKPVDWSHQWTVEHDSGTRYGYQLANHPQGALGALVPETFGSLPSYLLYESLGTVYLEAGTNGATIIPGVSKMFLELEGLGGVYELDLQLPARQYTSTNVSLVNHIIASGGTTIGVRAFSV